MTEKAAILDPEVGLRSLERRWLAVKKREQEANEERRAIEDEIVERFGADWPEVGKVRLDQLQAERRATYDPNQAAIRMFLADYPEYEGLVFKRQYGIDVRALKKNLELAAENNERVLADGLRRTFRVRVSRPTFSPRKG
jgi:hypothetical protein